MTVIGEQFLVGEVWESPRGTLYKVVERDGRHVTLRLGAYGNGRKVRREWDAIIGWVRSPVWNEEKKEKP